MSKIGFSLLAIGVCIIVFMACKSTKVEESQFYATLLTSKYASWVGGQPGVSGFNFEFSFSISDSSTFEVGSIKVNDQKINFEKVIFSADTATILASYTNRRPKDEIREINSTPINSLGVPERGEIIIKLGGELINSKITKFDKMPTSYYK